MSQPALGLFLAPGAGKTVIMLIALKILMQRGFIRRVIVIGTRRIIYKVWPDEARKWQMPYQVGIAHGKHKGDVLRDRAYAVVGVNYEAIPWLFSKENKEALKDFDVIILDESTKIKNWSAKRTQKLRWNIDKFKRRYIMTGSPRPKGLMNLFAQIYMLDLGEALGEYIGQYRNRFFTPAGYMGYDWQPLPTAERDINAFIKPLIYRVPLSELGLPKVAEKERVIQLPDDARKMYDRLEQEFMLAWKDGELSAAAAGVRTNKLRQIANGNVYTEGGKYIHVHEEKLDALEDLFEELNGQNLLVGYHYNHDLEHLRRRFPKAPVLHGGMKDADADRICDEWNEGAHQLLIAQPTVVAHGLNLQGEAWFLAFFSLDYNFEDYEQFIRRLARRGQKMEQVIAYRIIAENTVDEDVVAVLKDNDTGQKAFLKAMEDRWQQRRRLSSKT